MPPDPGPPVPSANRHSERMTDLAAVLFDFGGVIVEGPFTAFAEVCRRAGVSPDAVRQINSRDPDTNAWARAERGELDAEQFAEAFAAEAADLGHPLPAQGVLDVLAAMHPGRDRAHPAMLEVLDACTSAGLRLGLITNNVRPLGENPDADWVFDTFDVVVESSVEGTRKPEERIYRLALERLGVDAPAAVMLDDLGINLKPARTLGMRTIKVTDPSAAAAELHALLPSP